MSGCSGVSGCGVSTLHALQQLGARTADLIDRASHPDAAADPSRFAATLVEMSEVRMQTKAAMAALHTTNSLTEALLSLPRR